MTKGSQNGEGGGRRWTPPSAAKESTRRIEVRPSLSLPVGRKYQSGSNLDSSEGRTKVQQDDRQLFQPFRRRSSSYGIQRVQLAQFLSYVLSEPDLHLWIPQAEEPPPRQHQSTARERSRGAHLLLSSSIPREGDCSISISLSGCWYRALRNPLELMGASERAGAPVLHPPLPRPRVDGTAVRTDPLLHAESDMAAGVE